MHNNILVILIIFFSLFYFIENASYSAEAKKDNNNIVKTDKKTSEKEKTKSKEELEKEYDERIRIVQEYEDYIEEDDIEEKDTQKKEEKFKSIKSISSFTLGYELNNHKPYIQLIFKPAIQIEKFRFGFCIPVQFDRATNIKPEDFNSTEALFSLFNFFSYSDKYDKPIYAYLGQIEDYSLGEGLILSHYSNTIQEPDLRKIGLIFNFGIDFVNFELFAPDLFTHSIFAGRFSITPMKLLKITTPILNTLKAGLNYTIDIDPSSRSYMSREIPEEGYISGAINNDRKFVYTYSSEKSISVFGIDVSAEILNLNNIFIFNTFLEFDINNTSGTGLSLGLKGFLFPNIINTGFRIIYTLNNGYIPSYFNSKYQVEKYINPAFKKSLILDELNNKLFNRYYFELNDKFFDDKLDVVIALELFDTAVINPHFFVKISLDNLFDKLKLLLIYDRFDIKSLQDAFYNQPGLNVDNIKQTLSRTEIQISYFFTENISMTMTYNKSFILTSDNIIKLESFSAHTSVYF